MLARISWGTRLPLVLAFFVALSSFAASTGPISEETPPATCDPGWVVSEIQCTGSYCDNITIKCALLGNDRLGSSMWTDWVSEEGGGMRACPTNYYIAGFACRGSYCDNLSLYCVEILRASRLSCGRTARVSEENGGRLSFFSGDAAGQRFGAYAMKCTGSNCDNKEFDVCELALN